MMVLQNASPYVFEFKRDWSVPIESCEAGFYQGLRGLKDKFAVLVNIENGYFGDDNWKHYWHNACDKFWPYYNKYPLRDYQCCSWTLISYLLLSNSFRLGSKELFYGICMTAVCAYGMEDGLQRLMQCFILAFRYGSRVTLSLPKRTTSFALEYLRPKDTIKAYGYLLRKLATCI